jgi:hypothetical protein
MRNTLASVLLMIAGAVVDKFVHEIGGPSIAHFVEHVRERAVCPRNRLFAEGLAARREAILKRSETLHGKANAKLEHAASCGHLIATAHIGLGVCRGYGQQADPSTGAAIIRDAYERGARLSPDFFAMCRLQTQLVPHGYDAR